MSTLSDLVRVRSLRAERRSKYFHWLIDRHKYLELEDIRPPAGMSPRFRLESVYLTLRAKARHRSNEECLLDPAEIAGGGEPLAWRVVLGSPWAGKTTFLKHLTLKCAREQLRLIDARQAGPAGDAAPRFPVLVALREYERAGRPDLRTFLVKYPEAAGLPVPFEPIFSDAARRGELLLLFDGLDDVALPDRPTILNAIDTLLGPIRDRGNRVLLTSRPDGYEQSRPLAAALEYVLLDLDEVQIDALWGKWHGLLGGTCPPRLPRPVVRMAAANPGRLATIALVAGGCQFQTFDATKAIRPWLSGDGNRGVATFIIDAHASDAPAPRRVFVDAVALPKQDSASATWHPVNFFASQNEIDDARKALTGLLTGPQSAAMVAIWALAGRSAWISATVVITWVLLLSLSATLLLMPMPDGWVIGTVGLLIALGVLFFCVAVIIVVRCYVDTKHEGREWVYILENAAVVLALLEGDAKASLARVYAPAVSFALITATLVVLHRITDKNDGRSGLWRRIGRALEARGTEWTAIGGVTAGGAVRRDHLLTKKLTAAFGDVLVPWQSRRTRTSGRDRFGNTGPARIVRCVHLADALLRLGWRLDPRHVLVRVPLLTVLCGLVAWAIPDVIAATLPPPAPVVCQVVSVRPSTGDGLRDFLIVPLDTTETPDSLTVRITDSDYWIARESPAENSPSFCDSYPCAVVPLDPRPERVGADPGDGLVQVVRRRRMLWRDLLPLVVVEMPLWELKTSSGVPIVGGAPDGELTIDSGRLPCAGIDS